MQPEDKASKGSKIDKNKKTCLQTAPITDTTRKTVENNRVMFVVEQRRMGSNGILGQRAAGLGVGLLGRGGSGRGGVLMGSGRLVSPAGGPQEAFACGLALGRSATAVVRWADRLREKSPFPCGLPSTRPPSQPQQIPSLCTDAWGFGSNKLSRNKDLEI